MGIFGDIFKTLGNAVTAPIKSVGNIVSGKGNLGDLLNIGGTVYGLSGMGPIQNWNTTDFLNFAGVKDPTKMNTTDFMGLIGGNGQVNPKNVRNLSDWITAQSLIQQAQNMPKIQAAQDRAYNALSESSAVASGQGIAQSLLGQAQDVGARNAASLGNMGYGSGVADAAMLDARNRAASQGASVMSDLFNPAAQAQRATAQSQIYGNGLNTALAIQGAQNNQRIADAQYNASRPPSLFETILGVGGSVLPYVLDGQKKENTAKLPSGLPSVLQGLQRWGG